LRGYKRGESWVFDKHWLILNLLFIAEGTKGNVKRTQRMFWVKIALFSAKNGDIGTNSIFSKFCENINTSFNY